MLTRSESHQLLTRWNDTGAEYPQDRCIHQLFEEQVERTPDAVAVVFEDERLTYRQLNARANQLAHHLKSLGTGPEILVGICVDRSLEMIVGLLGILKAGGAYVPLDPTYPRDRLAYMVEDARVAVILTQEKLVPILREGVLSSPETHGEQTSRLLTLDGDWEAIAKESDTNPDAGVQPNNLAYTIYTSGSTGKPKGVEIEHRSVINFLTSMARQPGLTDRDTLLAVTTISFDIAGLELYLPLVVGARVVIAPQEVVSEGQVLAELIEDSGATVMQATPATWYLLLASGWQGKPGLKILCGGEALPQALADRLLATGAHLWNMYGPTEATIWSTTYEVGNGRRSADNADDISHLTQNGPESVGTPIANTQIYILDDEFQPVPIGEIGELYIGGDGLARGYRNRPDLTAERFIPNPFSPGRVYKTGDLARYLANGHIEFLGRIDHQVKVRGFRIELGEIETVLNRHGGVHQSVVVVKERERTGEYLSEADKRLVAYVVPDPNYQGEEEAETTGTPDEQISQWQELWDLAYSQETRGADPTFNISGWNDSYTGAPIPATEMREWLQGTVGRILSCRPQRVLEIGCGTGMLLFRVAPHCQSYRGIDLAPAALRYIETQIEKLEGDWSGVKLQQGVADDAIARIGPGEVDTVVINSVVQLFPNIDYLVEVLSQAVEKVGAGGTVFVGDVRSLPLQPAFHGSIQLQKIPDDLPRETLRKRVLKSIAGERQMAIDPDFFTALQQHLPQIGRVDIQLRRGRYHNEMSQFRYDAILHVGDAGEAVEANWVDWNEDGLSLAAVRDLLRTQPEILCIKGVPNARVWAQVKLLEWLDSAEGPATVGELRRILPQLTENAVEPEDWWSLGDEFPYRIAITGSGSDAPGCYDVIFQQDGMVPKPVMKTHRGPVKPWTAYANNPLSGKVAGELEPELRRYLHDRLPEYMVPAAFVILDEMPLTPNGKVNRLALPAPERSRPELATALVMPQTETEKAIASVWQDLLQLEIVGINDNFFDLGGNSLLLTQVHQKLVTLFDPGLSIVTLFQYPTIATLARELNPTSEESAKVGGSAHRNNGATRNTDGSDIAIIGLAGRFPGANNIDEFWQNLAAGVESISSFDNRELEFANPELLDDSNYVKAGGVLEDIDQFDAAFFGYSAKEAEIMDPQQRLFLESAWTAFESAGYNPKTYPGWVGVYAGSGMNSYLINNVHPNRGFSPHRTFLESAQDLQVRLTNGKDYLPTRVSYQLNLNGPSLNVQTACSTALVAVHMACRSLLNGECEMALAGGVTVSVPQKTGYLYQEGMIGSPDGKCRAFDADAKGTVFGNGVGVVVLKLLSQAIEDGDNIHAVIKGSAVNNDGALKVGYTAPSVEGQAAVISEALAVANIDPRTVGYIEAHGTGTSLGDPIEIAALTQAFRNTIKDTEEKGHYAIGSVKTNIGHLLEAAGIAGLIKTVLALKHKQIPPSLHFRQPNPNIDFDNSPFYVNTTLSEWEKNGTPRRAGVSSFGMGGTNCHLVLEEAPEIPPSPPYKRGGQDNSPLKRGGQDNSPLKRGGLGKGRPWHLLTLSAKTEKALLELAGRYVRYLDSEPEADLGDICFTANTGREHFNHRWAVVAGSQTELREQLAAVDSDSIKKVDGKGTKGAIAFLFTGQGSQYVNMGRQLYETQPTFRDAIARCNEILLPELEIPLLDVLYPPENIGDSNQAPINQTAYTQPALFALEYALYQLWISWGIEPDIVMGHSIGEYVAACVAGVFSLEDGLKLIAERGRLMQALPAGGAMVSLLATEERVKALIPPDSTEVSIAAINGPESIVISGKREAVQKVCATLEAEGVKTKPLTVSHAFHSPLMEPMLAEFEAAARRIDYSAPKMKLISNVTGSLARSEVATPEYWCRHVREAVRFAPGMKAIARRDVGVLIEVGPKPILLGMGRQCLPEHDGQWLPSLREGREDWPQLLTSLAELYLDGVAIDWFGFDRDYSRRRQLLPTYPFQRQRYWLETPEWYRRGEWNGSPVASVSQNRESTTDEPLENCLYEVNWQPQPLPPGQPQPAKHWLIFADRRGVADQLARRLRAKGDRTTIVVPGPEYRRKDDEHFTLDPDRPEQFQHLLQALPDVEGVIQMWGLDTPPIETVAELETATKMSLGSTLYLVQSLIKECAQLPKLWLITRGAQPAGEAANVPEIGQSPLWGMRKAIALEHPELHCRIIDLDPDTEGENEAELLTEIASNDIEDQVAFRNGTRYVPRLVSRRLEVTERSRSEEKQPLTLNADGTYLITGGMGGLGLRVAGAIARRGGKHLVLVGRGQPKPEVKERLKELETAGVRVITQTCDVSDTQQLAELLAHIDNTLPPLRGIVHAAGVVDFCGLWQQDWTRFSRGLAAKVQGTWNLHSLTGDRPLDFFVCFSSLASLLGSHGLASYGAANEFMDAIAHHRRSLGLPALSINWGPWAETGMNARLDADHRQRLSAWGLAEIAPDRGLALLEQLLQQQTAQVGVLPVDWSKWLRQFSEVPPFYDGCAVAPRQSEGKKVVNLARELEQMSPQERRSHLVSHLCALVAKTLGLKNAESIDPDAPLADLGLDSLMAMELRNYLKSSLGCSLGSTFLFKYPTVTALADYLEQQDFVTPGETASPTSSQPTSNRLGDRSTVVPIRPEGSKPPLFLVSGILGSVFDLYPLGKYLDSDRPFYGLRSLGTDAGERPPTRMEEIAAHHLQSIREIQPHGPYYLGGHSFGGKVAFEMARQLRSQGQDVAFLTIMDIQVGVPEPEKDIASWDESRCLANLSKIYGSILGKDLGVKAEALQLLSTQERLDYLHLVLKMAGQPLAQSDLQRMADIYKANTQASVEYRVQKSDPIPTVLFRAAEAGALGNYLPDEASTEADPTWGWEGATSVPIRLELVPGNHFTMISEPHVRVLAERLQLALKIDN